MIDSSLAFVFKDRPPGDEINILWMEKVYSIKDMEAIDKGTWDFYFEKLINCIGEYPYEEK